MTAPLNCPNCDAPVTQEKCPYCGSVFLDFAALQVGAPSYVKLKADGYYILARLLITDLSIESHADYAESRGDAGEVLGRVLRSIGYDIHLDAQALPDDTGGLLTIIVENERRTL